MRGPMRRTSALGFPTIFVIACVASCTHAPQPGAAATRSADAHALPRTPGAGPVVVSLVVDQMAAWIAAERWPELPATGGFARLRREGTWLRDMRYAHAVTDTAPGHSALYTGAVPRESGIVANEVIDAGGAPGGARVSVLRDPLTTMVDAAGAHRDVPGSSIAALRVETVADRLRAAHSDAWVVSLSLKDRGAIFAGGRAPTASVWFDPKRDRFVTSSAFAASLPLWAAPPPHPPAWELEDAAWVSAHAATPDAQEGEGDVDGFGTVFPHAFAAAKSPGHALRTSPFADDALLAMALAALDADRAPTSSSSSSSARRPYPSLIAVSLSANDYIGHAFGPDSWEAWDELHRLDAALARFFDALDARLGPAGWAAVLAADHGTTTMPEASRVPRARPWCAGAGAAKPDRWQRACGPVGRVLPDDLAVTLRATAERVLGKGDRKGDGKSEAHAPWIAGVADPYVIFTDAARALDAARGETLRAALTRDILARPEIARVIDVRTLPARCPDASDESVDALVCRATWVRVGEAAAGGDLYMVARPGSFFDPSVVAGKGTSHGSPYLFDRAVPMLARAPGRIEAGRVVDAPVSFRVFARTLASLLGIEAPAAARGAPDLVRSPP